MNKVKEIKKGEIYFSVDIDQYLRIKINKIQIDEVSTTRYKYSVLDQEEINIYEIGETLEEKYNRRPRRKQSRVIGGESITSFEHNDLYYIVNDSIISDLITKSKNNLELAKKNALRCPVTGGVLVRLDNDFHIFGEGSKYIVDGFDGIVWYSGSRVLWDVYSNDQYGHFKWNYENNKWVEQVIYDGWRNVDKPTTDLERFNLERLIQDADLKNREYKFEYLLKKSLGQYESLFPTAIRIYSKLTSNEVIKVAPLAPPIGLVLYMDYKA